MRFVFLALLASGPTHGYELKRRYDALFGAVWDPINVGQIYVTLGRLERDGLVTHTEVPQERGADRKDYELTELGRKALGGWLDEPAEVPVAKSDLLLRLVAGSLAGADIGPLVGEHRQRCLQSLRDLDAAAADALPGTVADLLIQGTALHLQAELRWLDRCDEVLLAGPVRLDVLPDPTPGVAGTNDEGTAR
jgi:DNA-binding PadR family transcriptional regulator